MTTAPPKRVLLIGGTSEIGLAIVRRLAADGPVRPFLLGRDRERLARALVGLDEAGCQDGGIGLFDAEDDSDHERAVNEAFEWAGCFDLAVLAVGVLGGQEGLQADRDRALAVMRTNFLGAGSLLLASLKALEASGGETMVVLSSVAAERVRATNAIYGASKAGLDALAQGLADATAASGVRVLVVRPGFVRSRMTEGLPSPPLATTPEAVADATVRALSGRAHTIWVPGRLRWIFTVLRHLPRPIYRRLPL
jgi:decaprenylphospho-beta-D-erythro-pentofuranosid-2-ulose 2-reductase